MLALRVVDDDRLRRRRTGRALKLCIAVLAVSGCASSQWVQVRDTPRNPLAGTLDLLSPGGPKPTARTMQFLRRYDLAGELNGDEAALLARLEDIQRREPNREHEYAMAEVAYITAKRAETLNRDRALEFYGTSLVHAYQYLFEQGAGSTEQGVRVGDTLLEVPGSSLNPFDPQFRGASDLYNQSLEGMLRLVRTMANCVPACPERSRRPITHPRLTSSCIAPVGAGRS